MCPADIDVALVDVEFGIGVEQYEHGCQLEGGAWLDAHAQREVITLEALVGFLVSLQVGDGFHLTSGHFHDDGAALFGFVLDDGVAEGAFCNVLDADVDGGHDVVAVDGVDVGFILNGNPRPVVDFALFVASVAAAEDGVAGALQSHQFVIADIADGAFGEGAVGVVALELGLRQAESAFVGTFVQEGESLHLLALTQGDVEVDEEVSLAVGLGVDEAFLPGGGVSFWEHGGQLEAELVDMCVEGSVVDDRWVDAHLKNGNVGSQHAAVTGEDVAA